MPALCNIRVKCLGEREAEGRGEEKEGKEIWEVGREVEKENRWEGGGRR